MLLWLNFHYLNSIENKILKYISIPFVFLLFFSIGFISFNGLSESLGVYGNVDSVVKKVQVTKQDLLREEQYGSNNYDIGEIDGTFESFIKVAPISVFTALFRPLLWESSNIIMVFSGLENTILLILTILIFFRISPIKLIKLLLKNPLLLYSIVFGVLFAFGVGVAGTNFGALVRYRTPLIPLFFPSIYIIYKLNRR